MAEILQQAMTRGRFDSVFTEVVHEESINESEHSKLRIFYLSSIEDRVFDTKGLVKLLRQNLGQYFFSRGEIKQFEQEDDVQSIGLEAASGLREQDYSRIFEEIMICYLLENKLGAPKLMSRPEILSASGKYEGNSDSIHFLPLGETPDAVRFQLVFGSAKVQGFIDTALDAVFQKIDAINHSKRDEKCLVESTLFTKSFSPETNEYLTHLLTPEKDGNTNKRTVSDNAFGVFIGYSLGMRADNRSTEDFLAAIDKKMVTDIQHYAPIIRERIKAAGLSQSPFYFFFIPLNDADNEKRSIIEDVLR